MTPVEFYFSIQHQNKKEERQEQIQYEVSRWTVRHMWNMQGKMLPKGHELNEVYDVNIFPWEKNRSISKLPQSLESMKEAMKSIFDFHNRKKNLKSKKK